MAIVSAVFEIRSDYSINIISDFIYGNRRYPDHSINEIYRRLQTWTYLKEDEDFWGVTKSEEVPADGISSINKTDLKCIENYATAIESNLKMAEMMRVLIPLPRSWTRSLKKELNTLRCMFENACQGMHKHCTYSFDRDTLVDIFYRLQEVSICTVELLQSVKNVADFCKQLSSTASKSCFNWFLNHVFGPIFRNVKDSIFKLNESMQANLHKYYAASVMYDVISIIIALLLFICQSSLGSATDMKQLMIFATVIHLIISGDVEINPGPEYDAADLYQKKPKISDLHRIFVKSKAASTWKTIDIALETEVDDSLIDGSSSAADKLGSVFKKWRQRGKDFTWGKIIQVCEDYDELGAVHHAIFEFLSSPEAHSEYGSEPDFDRTFTGSMTIHKESSRKNQNEYSNKKAYGLLITLNVLLVIAVILLLVLCSFIYQIHTLLLQGQGWPRETACRTDCEC
ncbi:PREDICTED: uncharacterized protein LOC109586058 [Amphimedon queenslandica]|uniref:Uncharacterized protein n=2 Tax=Amphimedon queenslandica TaxID=400682 RepID=A0AAN0JL94_AMPQE|nr:PREDICTED: uncharacterized protein LOC109586058 [Amphimedon queenslandica]|eukprot:XP_019857787.1 PREDICTED: uncharacterized protein LOC109586058 [Amphimedon queenslandica]